MKIDTAKAIQEKRAHILRIKKLRPLIEKLIAEAKAAESGHSSMPNKDWEKLRETVETEMLALGLVKVHRSYDSVTRSFSEFVEWPHTWSTVTVA